MIQYLLNFNILNQTLSKSILHGLGLGRQYIILERGCCLASNRVQEVGVEMVMGPIPNCL
jgi:hypothetical protein